eukprot:3279435-Rhodomonas_salina.2
MHSDSLNFRKNGSTPIQIPGSYERRIQIASFNSIRMGATYMVLYIATKEGWLTTKELRFG